jgi:hypothetical protein
MLLRCRQPKCDACSYQGHLPHLANEDLRRLLVNAAYWAAGLEAQIQAKADVDYVGEYKPNWFGFGKFKPGLKPEDLVLPE